ncbi:Sister chromatid cohesion protein 2 [Boothiomyces sp. JEL0838]|nr:Sister chromatid cohesion protein 2 [Boothiomyces sp. JEL0838]
MTIDTNLDLLENTAFVSLQNLDQLSKLSRYNNSKECAPTSVIFPSIGAVNDSQIILKNLNEETGSPNIRQLWTLNREQNRLNSSKVNESNISRYDNNISDQHFKNDSGELKSENDDRNIAGDTTGQEINNRDNCQPRIVMKLPSINGNLLAVLAQTLARIVESGEISYLNVQLLERDLQRLPPKKLHKLLLAEGTANYNFAADSFLRILNDGIEAGKTKDIGDCDHKEYAELILLAIRCIDVKLLFINTELAIETPKKSFCTLNEIMRVVSNLKTIFHNSVVSYFKLTEPTKEQKQFMIAAGSGIASILLKLVGLCQTEVLDEEIVISIFANYPGQQLFIIDELVSFVPKYYSSPSCITIQSGKSIHIYSFIIFQILQFGINVQLLEKKLSQSLTELESDVELNQSLELLNRFKSMQDCASRASLHFIQSLVKKATESGKDIKGKSSTEQEYKSILDGILKDLLLVYISPEWPIAEVLAQQSVRLMLQSLEDQKKSENAFRGISTDWLGDFAEVMIKDTLVAFEGKDEMINAINSLSGSLNESTLNLFKVYFKNLLGWISELSLERNFKNNLSLFHMVKIVQKITEHGNMEEIPVKDCVKAIFTEYYALKNQCFAHNTHSNTPAMYNIWIKSNGCFKMLDRMILTLLKGIDLASITVRTKSIRCFSELLNSSSIPRNVHNTILQSIQNRLVDSSPTVRDAAMDVCGKYILSVDEDGVLAIYPLLANRTTDLSIAVRKRVLKLIKELHVRYYKSSKISPILGDMLLKLLTRLQDEETTVSDLALKMLNEIYYPSSDAEHSGQKYASNHEILIKVLATQLGQCPTSANYFNLYLSQLSKKKTLQILVQTEKIINALFNLIIKQDGLEGAFITVQHFSKYFKELCTEHLSVLQPYIKPKGASEVEIRQSQLVLMILNNCFSDIKFNDVSLVRNIESDLLSLLGQGSVNYENEDIARLASKFTATILRCLVIVSLIVGNLNFEIKKTNGKKILYNCSELQAFTKGDDLTEKSFNMIAKYCSRLINHDSALIAFSAICSFLNARPKYFLNPTAMEIISKVFEADKPLLHIEFFNIVVEYLTGQQLEKSIDLVGNDSEEMKIEILVGNTDSFVEDGIPSSLVQNYLPRIIEKMLLPDIRVSRAAFKVVSLALEYGLVHPIICVPGLTALESSSDITIREHAFLVHKKLHEKHSSFIHTKDLEAINCLYTYQKSLAVNGNRDAIQSTFERDSIRTSFISPIYSLIKEKKSRRNEFLKQLINLFNIDKLETAKEAVYYKFIGESIAYLDFQTVEEIMHAIYHINVLLSFGANIVSQTLQGLSPTEERPHEMVIKALAYAILLSIKEYFKKKFKFTDLNIMEAKPASNAVSAQEKPLPQSLKTELNLNLPSDSLDICNWFEGLFEDNIDSEEYEEVTSKSGKREASDNSTRKNKKSKLN